MLGLEAMNKIREIREKAKQKAAHYVISGEPIDKTAATAEFGEFTQSYMGFLTTEMALLREKRMAELLNTVVNGVQASTATTLAFPQVKKALDAVAVPEGNLTEAMKKEAKNRAHRNARTGAPLNLHLIRSQCKRKFPDHVEAYIAYYESQFNHLSAKFSDEAKAVRMATKRGADAAKRRSHGQRVGPPLDEKALYETSLEFGQHASRYREAYREAFNKRRAMLKEKNGDDDTSNESDREVLAVPKHVLNQYPALSAYIRHSKPSAQVMSNTEVTTKMTMRKRHYVL